MRYRIDGVLYDMIPPAQAPGHGHHQPHQGHVQPGHRRTARTAGTGASNCLSTAVRWTFAWAVLPTVHGESVVMRVLDRSNISLDLAKPRLVVMKTWTYSAS